MNRIVVGLVGPIASGKGTAVKMLTKKGFASYSLSDRIREEIRRRGQEVTRESLNLVSNEMRQSLGRDILPKQTADLINSEQPSKVTVDAIRNPAEIIYFKEKFGAKIIGVVADQKKRFEFFEKRGTNNIGIETWEQFKALDDQEFAQEGKHKQQINECLKLADVIIENNGTIEELKTKIDSFIASVGPLA